MSDSLLDKDKENLLDTSTSYGTGEVRRLKGLAVAGALVGGIVYGAVRDDEGLMHVFRERSRLQDLNHSVENLRDENNRLRAEIKALREDPRSVEKRAREDLGLSKEGEIVFILESETPELKRP